MSEHELSRRVRPARSGKLANTHTHTPQKVPLRPPGTVQFYTYEFTTKYPEGGGFHGTAWSPHKSRPRRASRHASATDPGAALPAPSEAGSSLEGHGSRRLAPLPSPQPAPRSALGAHSSGRRRQRTAERLAAPQSATPAVLRRQVPPAPSPLTAACPGNSHHTQFPVLSTSMAPPGPERPPLPPRVPESTQSRTPGTRRHTAADTPRHLTSRGPLRPPGPAQARELVAERQIALRASPSPARPALRQALLPLGPAGAHALAKPQSGCWSRR